jgi:hypothetical protein
VFVAYYDQYNDLVVLESWSYEDQKREGTSSPEDNALHPISSYQRKPISTKSIAEID